MPITKSEVINSTAAIVGTASAAHAEFSFFNLLGGPASAAVSTTWLLPDQGSAFPFAYSAFKNLQNANQAVVDFAREAVGLTGHGSLNPNFVGLGLGALGIFAAVKTAMYFDQKNTPKDDAGSNTSPSPQAL